MPGLTTQTLERARDLIALYPEPRSALIPILHLAQEQEGWLTPDAMQQIGDLLDITSAEVLGTATFYDMFFTHPVGRHLVAICTNIACMLNGAEELLEHAEKSLGISAGATTADGEFTLEEAECLALCGNAPCLTVNWRYFGNVTEDAFDRLTDDLRAGRLANDVPPHGTLVRVRRDLTAWAGAAQKKTDVTAPPREEGAASTAQPAESTKTSQTAEPQPAEDADIANAPGHAGAVENTGEGEGEG